MSQRIDELAGWADVVDVGWWYTGCCHLDLAQIENKDELIELLRELVQGDCVVIGVWKTEKDALLEIRNWSQDAESIKQIDERLSRLSQTKGEVSGARNEVGVSVSRNDLMENAKNQLTKG